MDKEIIAIKETVIELIVNIDKRIDDITVHGKNDDPMIQERIRNVLEDMQVLAEGIDAISGYFKGLDLLEFKEKLEMLVKAIEVSDTSLFNDIMQFEIKDLLGYWMDSLTK